MKKFISDIKDDILGLVSLLFFIAMKKLIFLIAIALACFFITGCSGYEKYPAEYNYFE